MNYLQPNDAEPKSVIHGKEYSQNPPSRVLADSLDFDCWVAVWRIAGLWFTPGSCFSRFRGFSLLTYCATKCIGYDVGSYLPLNFVERYVMMGRPPKPAKELKSETLRIRMTKAERALLERVAKSQNEELSAWARRVMLNEASQKALRDNPRQSKKA